MRIKVEKTTCDKLSLNDEIKKIKIKTSQKDQEQKIKIKKN